ncbi:TlpA disulfide reductase family protein [Lacinutrix jangbogonensis]|uniref:TlpA disulfide reductase family protein n=1 Tax=Lacinutrix jangbogonensis TaxID=1469557 RepID=UPI00053E0EFF|nr:TlpA disulfide reductase family protein [Lacinutrix jangbogonensis]
MKVYVLLLVILFSACKQEEVQKLDADPVVVIEKSNAKDIDLTVYNFNELEPLLNKKDGKVYVINFWATWCAPCVKELPYFETLNEEYKNINVDVVLVSLDFPKQYDTKLKPFITKHKLKSRIVVLNDVDSNTWIPKVDKDWTGAIPATIIYNNSKRTFYEKSFNLEELKLEVNKFIE